MQKKLWKTMIFIIIMLLIWGNKAIAMEVVNWDGSDMEESISETADDSMVSEKEELEEEEDEIITVGSTNEDMERDTSSNAATSKAVTSSTSQPTKTYSTIATIPEANLSLNNILNVILIAVGVILILLAIAILIRMR